jgi:hypothetical protein
MKEDKEILKALDSLLETLQNKFREKEISSTNDDEDCITNRQVKELLELDDDEINLAFACGAYNALSSILKEDRDKDFLNGKSVIVLSGIANEAVKEINKIYKKIKLKKEKN